MRTARHLAFFTGAVAFASLGWSYGCGGIAGDSGGGGTGGNGNGTINLNPPGGGMNVIQCTSQGQCVNHLCANSGHTTISGTVYDPAGTNPLYDIAVYVPAQPPTPLPKGAHCDACQTLYTGGVVAGTLTDAAGHFIIQDAPTGNGVPLVVQIGKWRRQYVTNVNDCQDNPEPQLRLPRNQAEGDLPDVAISTGGADSLECLFRRIGVDASEYTSGASNTGHIHIFQGGTGARGGRGGGGAAVGGAPTPGPTLRGGSPASATALWQSTASLMAYDIVLLSCEGGETANPNAQPLNDYASMGGRVFASHFHYAWFLNAPFSNDNLATWNRGTNDTGNINGVVQTTLPGGGAFPKGVALKQWLTNVKALTAGVLPIQQSRHNANVTAANTPSTPWIDADQNAPSPGATQYFSFDLPINAPTEQLCGRVVYSDLHVGAASLDYGQQPGAGGPPQGSITPSGCANNALSPQEKALEFMVFDLSSCLTPVGKPPVAPGPTQ
jgi:hypothetical protein